MELKPAAPPLHARKERPAYPVRLLPARDLTPHGARRVALPGDAEKGCAGVWYRRDALGAAAAAALLDPREGVLAQCTPFLHDVGDVARGGGRRHAVFLWGDDLERESSAARGAARHAPLQYRFGGRWWPSAPTVPPALRQCHASAVAIAGVPALNGCVINVYESERSKIGWHADDEFHLGPVVCTLSLGRPQTMEFRARDATNAQPQAAVELEHDSLLIMGAGTQEHYLHRILQANPQQRAQGPCRVSITFHHHRLDLLEKLQPEPT
jgi:hypothetical protein